MVIVGKIGNSTDAAERPTTEFLVGFGSAEQLIICGESGKYKI